MLYAALASAQRRIALAALADVFLMTLDQPTTADEAPRAGLEAYCLGHWEQAHASSRRKA